MIDFAMKELIALLNEIKPQYGAVGSRDVDVTAQRKRIDEAIAMLKKMSAVSPEQTNILGYFSFDPDDGAEILKDRQTAIDNCNASIDLYRESMQEEYQDGWSDDVKRVCWGVILQEARGFDAQGIPENDPNHTYQTLDYRLAPDLTTAVTTQPESEIPFGDVEPIEVTDDMVYAFHNRLSDGSLTSDEFTDIKQGLCAALMNIPLPTQQAIPEPKYADFHDWLKDQKPYAYQVVYGDLDASEEEVIDAKATIMDMSMGWKAAIQSSAQPVIPRELRSFVTDADIEALHRFAECCDDPESGGHDLEKEQVQRLEKIGALQRSGRISYITDFGDYLISVTADKRYRSEG